MPDSSTQYKGVITPSSHLFSFLSWTLNTDVLVCSNSPSMSVKPVSPKPLDQHLPRWSPNPPVVPLLPSCPTTNPSRSFCVVALAPVIQSPPPSAQNSHLENKGAHARILDVALGSASSSSRQELLHLIAALGSGLPDRHQPPRWKRKLQHTPTLPSAPHAHQVPPRWDLSGDKHICISSTAAGRGVTMEIPRLQTADDLIRSKNARRNGPSRGQHHCLPK